MNTKLCPQCKTEKTFEQFGYRTGKRAGQLKGLCKDCRVKATKEWTAKNPEKAKAQRNAASARWNIKVSADSGLRSEKAHVQRRYNAVHEYGLTFDEFHWVETVGYYGQCEACGKDAKDCKHGRLVIDHVHSHPPKFRGMLCPSCNFCLGDVQDSIERLEKLIAYLKAKGSVS
jgi:hypothetical protein